jgi:flagellar hook-length control protein FliK
LGSEIARQVERGKKSFDIRLDPAELGKVRVKLDLGQEGEVRAHLIVERKETLDQLQRDQRVLERALQSAGLDLAGGGLQFSLSSGGQERSGGEAPQTAPRRASARESDAVAETPLAPPPRVSNRTGGVDVRI